MVASNSSDREEAASKIGFFAMCCFKSLIAARLATSVFFAPVSAITGNTNTTIPKPQARPPRFKMNGSAGASRRKYGDDSFWSARLTTSALPSKPRAILEGYRGISLGNQSAAKLPRCASSIAEALKARGKSFSLRANENCHF